ncbi:MAG: hypothetical protein ACREOK_01730 [Gemmatimonadaceae bacterium]
MAGPFEAHLLEAIALNRQRAPGYAERSSGASRSISRMLIGAERLLVPVARWYDRRARPYHRNGVPLLDALFVSMSTAPRDEPLAPDDALLDVPAPDVSSVRRRVWTAFRHESFAGAASILASERRLLTNHQVNCMVRHLLESAHRLTLLAPVSLAASRARGLPSPERLLASLLRLHLLGLGRAAALDRRARPLQAKGIGILTNDLPAVPSDLEPTTVGKEAGQRGNGK